MTATLIGYARCSTDKQDLAAQQAALEKLGVAPERIYTDRGLTGTNRSRPGLDQALAAVRTGSGHLRRGPTHSYKRRSTTLRPSSVKWNLKASQLKPSLGRITATSFST